MSAAVMPHEGTLPSELVDEIRNARAAKDRAILGRNKAAAERVSLAPLWELFRVRRVENSIGDEYDLALVPKGAA
jgi:hypothetical protein